MNDPLVDTNEVPGAKRQKQQGMKRIIRLQQQLHHPVTRLLENGIGVLEEGEPTTNTGLDTKCKTSEARIVCMVGEDIIGTIPTSVVPLEARMQDIRPVEHCGQEPGKKTCHEAEHARTLRLLSTLSLSMNRSKYQETPFPHGTDSVEEMLLVGADKFETIMRCYNLWFDNCTQLEQVQRVTQMLNNNNNMDAIPPTELKQLEADIRQLWTKLHSALMSRLR